MIVLSQMSGPSPQLLKEVIDAINALTIGPQTVVMRLPTVPTFAARAADRKDQKSIRPLTDWKDAKSNMIVPELKTSALRNGTAAATAALIVPVAATEPHPYRLQPEEVDSKLQQFFRDNQLTTTKKSYATYQRRFKEFMHKRRYPLRSEHTNLYVSEFIMGCAQGIDGYQKLGASTILNSVSGAIADLYRFDTDSPTSSKMFKTTKAAVRKAAPKPKKAKAPLPVARLRELIEATRRDPNRLAAARKSSHSWSCRTGSGESRPEPASWV